MKCGTCGEIGFVITDLYQQHMNIMAIETRKSKDSTFENCVLSTEQRVSKIHLLLDS
jgi:hypothetical protein